MENRNICNFCVKNVASYRCPKCAMAFCSTECYKSKTHEKCSEEFYKNWCITQLKSREESLSFESKAKIERILAREKHEREMDYTHENPEGEEEEEEDDLAGQFSHLDLESCDASEIWRALSPAEKRKFNVFVESVAPRTLNVWKPWWFEDRKTARIPKNLFAVTSSSSSSDSSVQFDDNLCATLLHSLASLLLSYAYICRTLNGEHQLIRAESLDRFRTVCPQMFCVQRASPINHNQPIKVSDVHCVIAQFKLRLAAAHLPLCSAMLLALCDDVIAMLKITSSLSSSPRNDGVITAIADAFQLTKPQRNKQEEQQDKQSEVLSQSERTQFRMKLKLFVAWILHSSSSSLPSSNQHKETPQTNLIGQFESERILIAQDCATEKIDAEIDEKSRQLKDSKIVWNREALRNRTQCQFIVNSKETHLSI